MILVSFSGVLLFGQPAPAVAQEQVMFRRPGPRHRRPRVDLRGRSQHAGVVRVPGEQLRYVEELRDETMTREPVPGRQP